MKSMRLRLCVLAIGVVFASNVSLADPLDNWHWRKTGGELKGIAYGNGVFVAVGEYSTILISPDGINFTLVNGARMHPWPPNLAAITYNNNLFVAVGESGTILTSTDGITWTKRDSGVSWDLQGVTYGNGLFVAVGDGGNIVTSPDGINWIRIDTGTDYFLSGIGYGNGTFVLVGVGRTTSGCCLVDIPVCRKSIILTSHDGTSWIENNSPTSNCSLRGVTFGDGIFVAVGEGATLTSPDGITWSDGDLRGNFNSVAYLDGMFVAVGYGGIITSPDGTNWTLRERGWGSHGIAYGNDIFVVVGEDSSIFTSPDAQNWTDRTPKMTQDVIYANGTFFAVGSGIQSSSDGVTWTKKTRKDLGISGGLQGITYGKGTFVAVGGEEENYKRYGLILTSTDGIDWKRSDLTFLGSLNSVTYGNGTFVAVGITDLKDGNYNYHDIFLTSSDGVNWTKTIGEVFLGLSKIIYGNGVFVAFGGYENVVTSADGVNWLLQRDTPDYFQAVTYGNGLFVALGDGVILTSSDGRSWTTRVSGDLLDINSIGYRNGTFVATSNTSIFTSVDAIIWIKRTNTSAGTHSITYGNGTFLAVGEGIFQSDPVAASQYLLTLVKPGKGNGTISSSPAGIDCGSDCAEMYDVGSEVTLVATPSEDSIFTGWSGACSGIDTTCTVTITNGPNFVMANFSPESVSTPKTPDGATSGKIGISYTYMTGASSSNLGHPVEYQFEWSGEGSDLSPWGSASQSKTWTTAGLYNVRARARCAQDISVVSDWSSVLTVKISVPDISVTPAVYDYGNIKVKRSKKASFSVKNDGTVNLTLSSSIVGADASIFRIRIGGGSKKIKPGKTLTINVAFRPASAGSKEATLRITSNDPSQPIIDIPLNGTGM